MSIKRKSVVSVKNNNKQQLKKEAEEWVVQAKKDSKKWNEMINGKYKGIKPLCM